jgi:formate--tetrahydrofolate ligase
VVTEAGFGADLGAEKFLDIKCRKSGLRPSAAVIVATVRALKYHGGAALADLTREDLLSLERGLVNLERHIDNVRNVYGIACVVSINRFDADTEAEIAMIRERVSSLGVQVVLATHWRDGSAGAADLAEVVVGLCAQPSAPTFVYQDSDTLWEKMTKIATRVYRAESVTADAKVRAQIDQLQAAGYGQLPVCVAKTQSSFSTDPSRRGAPSNHTVNVREVRLSAGAGFVVMICGDIMTMPGLPKVPAATRIDLVDGRVVGLF